MAEGAEPLDSPAIPAESDATATELIASVREPIRGDEGQRIGCAHRINA